jgi:hypothetical protein
MARVNVEEKLFTDNRFKALVRRIGDEDRAVGMMIRAFRLAQTFWGQDRGLIPLDLWNMHDLHILIDCLLAEKRDTGVYVKGSEQYFDWYLRKIKASAKGVKAKVEKRPIGLTYKDNHLGEPLGLTTTESSDKDDCCLIKSHLNGEPLGLTTKVDPLLLSYSSNPLNLNTNSNTNAPQTAKKPRRVSAPLPVDFLEIWNSHRGNDLAPARGITGSRAKHAAARAKENSESEYWTQVVQRIAASDFCCGRKPGSSWKATLDWLLKPDTHIKVLEGQYDNFKAKSNRTIQLHEEGQEIL